MELDYYNNHYKHVNKNYDFNSYKKVILREHGKILKDKNKAVLDIGCGTGYLLQVLEDLGFSDLSGVEISKTQFDEAKKVLKKSKIYNNNIFDFFIENNNKQYDIIFIYDLLEHIEKDKIITLLNNIYNALNKNGILVIRTPNADSPIFSGKMRYIDFTHTISFNNESINMILRTVGFNQIENKKTERVFVSIIGRLITFPLKILGDILLRLYLFTYIGPDSFKTIFTPNFITIAKK